MKMVVQGSPGGMLSLADLIVRQDDREGYEVGGVRSGDSTDKESL